jgi:rRNA small subunit pseudouridine methyltransferase Nep1
VIDHLPVGCTKIGTSFHADITDPRDLVPDNEPVVFVVGALAHGSDLFLPSLYTAKHLFTWHKTTDTHS